MNGLESIPVFLAGFIVAGLCGLILRTAQGVSLRWVLGTFRIVFNYTLSLALLTTAVVLALWVGGFYQRVTCFVTTYPGCSRPMVLLPGMPPLSIGSLMGSFPFLAIALMELWFLYVRGQEERRADVVGAYRPRSLVFQGAALLLLLRRVVAENGGPLLFGAALEGTLSYGRVHVEIAQLKDAAIPFWIQFAITWALSLGVLLCVTFLVAFTYRLWKHAWLVWASPEEGPAQVFDLLQGVLETTGALLANVYTRLAEALGFVILGLKKGSKHVAEDAGMLISLEGETATEPAWHSGR